MERDIKRRKTKQRKIILEEIKKVKTHPTAEQIFEMVKKELPDIGIATVYRNLNYLVKTNKIIQLRSKDKNESIRYDGCTDKHCHLICKRCNHVIDLFDVKTINIQSDELKKSQFSFDPSYAEMFGLCKNCKGS